MTPLRFCFVLHIHQPVGNFEHVFREHADDVYTPFLDFLEARGLWPIGLHVSGPLLEWLGEHDQRLHDRIGRLAADGRVELLSGGWYEPILAALAPADRAEQLGWMREELESRFGVTPTGAWLTERVWEPDLARDFAEAGLEYVLVDDHLATRSGVPAADLDRPLRTESAGRVLDLLPIDERLRYLIPFRPADEIAAELRARHRGGCRLALIGDDGEKFGGWPRTRAWLYEGGWLEAFGDRMDELRAEGVLRWVTPAEARSEVPATGPVYLPSGSYPEMEEWARGGHWKGFLSRYPEANRMHKRMMALTELCRSRGDPPAVRRAVGRAQCNDAYWHGVFGGLYMKHLREGVRRNLLVAERLLRSGEPLSWTRQDVDANGAEEWWVHGEAVSAWVGGGGCVSELVWLDGEVDVLDVLTRYREEYHDAAHLRWTDREAERGKGSSHAEGAQPTHADASSIHDIEEAAVLELLPPVDEATRVLVRDRVIASDTNRADYEAGAYEAIWTGDTYRADEPVGRSSAFRLTARTADAPRVERTLSIGEDGAICYQWRWRPEDFPEGALFAPEISLGAEVAVSWSPPTPVWHWPIVTTSKCPEGFEEIEQGLSITPLWPISEGHARVEVTP